MTKVTEGHHVFARLHMKTITLPIKSVSCVKRCDLSQTDTLTRNRRDNIWRKQTAKTELDLRMGS